MNIAETRLWTPAKVRQMWWPGMVLTEDQDQSIDYLRSSKEVHTVAGNQLGKDYTAGWIALSFFLAPWIYFPEEYVREVGRRPGKFPHTRRVVVTSVRDKHIDVLFAEIGRHISECKYPLVNSPKNPDGPLIVNHHEVRFAWERESKTPMNYLIGQVSQKGEGMAGHHAAYTLGIGDEASGIEDEVYKQFQGWAKKMFFFGNPNPCHNFWRSAVEAGDVLLEEAA